MPIKELMLMDVLLLKNKKGVNMSDQETNNYDKIEILDVEQSLAMILHHDEIIEIVEVLKEVLTEQAAQNEGIQG